MAFAVGFMFEVQSGARKRIEAGWVLMDKRADRGDGTGELAEEDRDPLLPRHSRTLRSLMIRGRRIAISIKRQSVRGSFRFLESAGVVCGIIIIGTGNVSFIVPLILGLVCGAFLFRTSSAELLKICLLSLLERLP